LPAARAIVAEEWPLIGQIAAALLQHHHLDYDELRRLIG
jgi:hypothetical protein